MSSTNLYKHIDGECDKGHVVEEHQVLKIEGLPIFHILWSEPDEEKIGGGQDPNVVRIVVE